VVKEVPDYRSAFGDELNFIRLGRQVKNNERSRPSYPAGERVTRDSSATVTDLGRLLYHELAHASDYFAPADRSLDPSWSMWRNVSGRFNARALPSDALVQQYPLTSPEMLGLGQVLYRGVQASPQQKAYSAADVARFFASDRASDEYAYSIFDNSNSREDPAMLFEEFMMSYRHGIQYDTAYTARLTPGTGPDQVLDAWGQRGRIAEPAIKLRAQLVLQRMAPWIDPAAVDALPAPIMMRTGDSWNGNLVLGPPSGMSKQSARPIPDSRDWREDVRKRPHDGWR
jgi:hypothetical protein